MAVDPAKQAFSLFDEFKNFAFKGNVIDMAVGVIIGGAFGKIVSSMVDNVFMPFIAAVISGGSKGAVDKDGKPVALQWFDTLVYKYGDMPIPYGKFVGEVVSFLILALVLFIFIVKFVGWVMKSKKAEAAAPPPPPPADVALLTEIRDLLKAKN